MAKKDEDTADTRLARLILALRSQGVSEPAVLNAIEKTPREAFTPDLFKDRAFEFFRRGEKNRCSFDAGPQR